MKIFRLREILDNKSITGKQLSNTLGVTEATISNLVKGEAIPRKDLLLKIADVLDVDVRDLFEPTKKDKSIPELLQEIRTITNEIENRTKK